ncbi:hypothetical protein [Maribacter forsetii]|uniref:hypothetical protein n=1 Tax=Maribacter forsetii TaxID=444515 RepID=UPI0005658FBE|nr:hypothetical protein [Maribacter forsetii]
MTSPVSKRTHMIMTIMIVCIKFLVTAVMSNMLVKLGIALFKGSKVTGKLVGYTFAGIIVVGFLYAVIAK